jgi:peptidoglycan-N-acetylglucosamine deacetylase
VDGRLLLTSSWDDGDPADLRLAEVLASHGLRGTFYLCRFRGDHPRLSDSQIRELAALPGVEVGSHTVTHPNLRRLNGHQLDAELNDSKAWLEDVIGEAITSFCYPGGLHRRSMARRVAAAGYSVGRTTMSGHTELPLRPLLMPTTLQVYPHSKSTQLRHLLKEGDLHGFNKVARLRPWSLQPAELARGFVRQARIEPHSPAVIHIWGHSWELTETRSWPALQDLLRYLRDAGCHPKFNRDLALLTESAGESGA